MSLWKMTDEEASKPTYLSDTLRNEQSVSDLDATVGVDASEETVTANKAKGMQHPGWVTIRTYTDQHGNTRYKSETLVAAGSMTSDASDDSTVADLAITIGTQPQNASVTAPAAATFTVVATINSTTAAPLAYQWQVQQEGAGAWADISGAISASYTTGATATGDAAGATDGDKYRVVITSGNATVTSSAATLTVA